jgi:hypothetical protein
LVACNALTTDSVDTFRTHLAYIAAIPTILPVPVEVRAGAAAVRTAHIAPALAVGAVGVLDTGVAALTAMDVVVLQVHALAGAGSQAVLGTRVDFVIGAGC